MKIDVSETPMQSWISVEERLPPHGEAVYIWLCESNMHPRPAIGCLDVNGRDVEGWFLNGHWKNKDDVSHWQPLPPPPSPTIRDCQIVEPNQNHYENTLNMVSADDAMRGEG